MKKPCCSNDFNQKVYSSPSIKGRFWYIPKFYFTSKPTLYFSILYFKAFRQLYCGFYVQQSSRKSRALDDGDLSDMFG